MRGAGRNLSRRGGALWVLLVGAAMLRGAPAVLFSSGPGRFEIAAVNAEAARPVLAAAQSVWPALREPLDLPEAFSSPVLVRLVPAEEWPEAAPFRVSVEAPGLVSLRISGARDAEPFLRRALVQALLMRKAVALHGVTPRLAAPLWLELGAVEAWQAWEQASRLDALKRTAAMVAPPSLEELLHWSRGEVEPEAKVAGAYWLLTWLRVESGRDAEWRRLLADLLGGADAERALAADFAGAFSGGTERALWWRTGWHHLRRVPTLPLLSAADSRALLADATRVVVLRDGVETVLRVGEWRDFGRSGSGREWLDQRGRQLAARTAGLHPFYRNAALSLRRVLELAGRGAEPAWAEAVAQFEADWRDASELEAASARALDALEKRG